MLGFGALGQLALGEQPALATTTVLSASSGSYAISGQVSTFTVKGLETAGAYALSGQAATFRISQASSAGAYALTGNAATFTTGLTPAAGTYALTGNAAGETVEFFPNAGAYTLTGTAAYLSVNFNGQVIQITAAGPYYTRKRHREYLDELEREERQRQLDAELARQAELDAQRDAWNAHKDKTAAHIAGMVQDAHHQQSMREMQGMLDTLRGAHALHAQVQLANAIKTAAAPHVHPHDEDEALLMLADQ